MPFSPDDTARKRHLHHPPSESAAHDWQDDLSEIIGEPFSFQSVLLRVHQSDVPRIVAEWVRATIRTSVLDVEYRIRDRRGDYVRVRARINRLLDENWQPSWTGAVRRVRIDTPSWTATVFAEEVDDSA